MGLLTNKSAPSRQDLKQAVATVRDAVGSSTGEKVIKDALKSNAYDVEATVSQLLDGQLARSIAAEDAALARSESPRAVVNGQPVSSHESRTDFHSASNGRGGRGRQRGQPVVWQPHIEKESGRLFYVDSSRPSTPKQWSLPRGAVRGELDDGEVLDFMHYVQSLPGAQAHTIVSSLKDPLSEKYAEMLSLQAFAFASGESRATLVVTDAVASAAETEERTPLVPTPVDKGASLPMPSPSSAAKPAPATRLPPPDLPPAPGRPLSRRPARRPVLTLPLDGQLAEKFVTNSRKASAACTDVCVSVAISMLAKVAADGPGVIAQALNDARQLGRGYSRAGEDEPGSVRRLRTLLEAGIAEGVRVFHAEGEMAQMHFVDEALSLALRERVASAGRVRKVSQDLLFNVPLSIDDAAPLTLETFTTRATPVLEKAHGAPRALIFVAERTSWSVVAICVEQYAVVLDPHGAEAEAMATVVNGTVPKELAESVAFAVQMQSRRVLHGSADAEGRDPERPRVHFDPTAGQVEVSILGLDLERPAYLA